MTRTSSPTHYEYMETNA